MPFMIVMVMLNAENFHLGNYRTSRALRAESQF